MMSCDMSHVLPAAGPAVNSAHVRALERRSCSHAHSERASRTASGLPLASCPSTPMGTHSVSVLSCLPERASGMYACCARRQSRCHARIDANPSSAGIGGNATTCEPAAASAASASTGCTAPTMRVTYSR
ncbi:hypothetical protein Ctob_003962 [Chrysochromulina tobinii]|uniref:Uncharacterized protein n=1 Tax=Chrysochromulina tobinii TaxID=1460289 RepID=A0A0M0JPT5_9EUKA|nr:hypothetical protein Ctob_003962 [Chrysochromulina tobinii]|eukprot:KOO28312.1 hypothetical protein Ctob_003962 [Chrysochromulina sp. CCMP291]